MTSKAKPRAKLVARKKPVISKVAVRMYNVGFGDSFLVTYIYDDLEYHILIDCGSIAGAITPTKPTLDTIVDDIIKRCTVANQARIDVVVATHRHRDHLSGFEKDAWGQVEVGEVWLPWTEDPGDSEATTIRELQLKIAETINRDINKKPELVSMKDAIFNATSNPKAMNLLLHGFQGDVMRRFLPETAPGELLVTEVLPGARVHILGPSKDPKVIKNLNPPSGTTYLNLAEFDSGNGKIDPLFGAEWTVNESNFRIGFSHLKFLPDEQQKLQELSKGTELLLAAALDGAINGTSLVLVLELGNHFLLFPGDAQWGTWNAMLNDPAIVKLLGKTTLFKVGHHGSHNATPIDFVNKHLSDKIPALVSTRTIKKWPDIPRKPLIEALEKKSIQIVRSDQPFQNALGITQDQNDLYTEIQLG